MLFTDSHAHLYDSSFDDDISLVVARARECGVHRVIVPSTDSSNHHLLLPLEQEYSGFAFSAYGLHPTSINECGDINGELEMLEGYLSDKDLHPVAVGEMGFDMYWSKEYVEQQIFAFRAQAELSIKYNLPLIIHVRDAFELLHQELSPFKGRVRGVIHGFSGTVDDYHTIKSYRDFKFGIGGVVTFKNSNLKEVVAQMSLDDILLETDCPYLSPVPNRGKRNEPSNISLIAAMISEVKKCEISEVSAKTQQSCELIFDMVAKDCKL